MPSKTKSRALRFTHLSLENWRNFTKVDADLQARAFFVGPNASGKSNLLDAFRFLHDLVDVGGGFQQAVRARGGVSSLRCLAARRYPDISVTVRIGEGDSDTQWLYGLKFKQDNQRRPQVSQEVVQLEGRTLLSRPDEDDESDPDRLTQTFLEQVNVNRDYRDIADFFRQISYRHIIPQLVREPERSVGRSNDPYGGDFLEQIASTSERTQQARLRRISEAIKVAVPQMRDLELYRDDRGTPHLRGRYNHWRPQGAWQSEDRLSDGTLRLLGLLWAVLDGSGPLLLEEPELSLHPEVVRLLPQVFAGAQRRNGRQVLISTHSEDLLMDDGIGLDEVFYLKPGDSGTEVIAASKIPEATVLLEAGQPLSEVVMSRSRPDGLSQLVLFSD